jgi:hypothetical protein
VNITQHLVLTRGDTRDITLTMPAGSDLDLATSVRFTARDGADDVLWTQELTPSSDTVAVATIGAVGSTDWADWTTSDEPEQARFDFEVVDEDGKTHTVAQGILTIVSDQSR